MERNGTRPKIVHEPGLTEIILEMIDESPTEVLLRRFFVHHPVQADYNLLLVGDNISNEGAHIIKGVNQIIVAGKVEKFTFFFQLIEINEFCVISIVDIKIF